MTDEKKQTILIVEDEPSLRDVLRDKLTIEGFAVLQAVDGEEGLEVILREHPDLILLDIMMPKMDGLTMLKMLRADAWGAKAKVILLTNSSDNEKVAEAMAQGTYDYLVKSDWKIDDVAAKIRERLSAE
jgi:Response regulator containing CheY-like receiver, AAA-type ATPase, and DNA-binding domains